MKVEHKFGNRASAELVEADGRRAILLIPIKSVYCSFTSVELFRWPSCIMAGNFTPILVVWLWA